MGRKIKLDQEQIEILNKDSSSFHKLWSEVASEYAQQELDLINRSQDSLSKVVGAIGLVAGFGFTGLGSVKRIYPFITGEFLFLLAVAIGSY